MKTPGGVKKIVVVNKYHFVSGGAERYFLSILDALKRRGMDAMPLSVDYSKSLETPYRKHFIPPVMAGGEAKIINQNPNLTDRVRLAARAIYNVPAKRCADDMIQRYRPDLMYLLNINNHISPSVIDACHARGVPVVMRLSDFNMICASNMFYRDRHPCRDCKQGLHHAVLHRCVHNSYVKSMAGVAANTLHRWMGIYKKVSAFVTPTVFMKNELVDMGIAPGRIHQIDTFVSPQKQAAPDTTTPHILFVGRFAEYKGAQIAIEAFARSGVASRAALRLLGDENDEDSRQVKLAAARPGVTNVEILPFERDPVKCMKAIRDALFVLVPSKFYENMPNTVLEAYACGRPVLATRLGSLPEIVRDGHNGLLFEYGDTEDFATKIRRLTDDALERSRMGENALRDALERFSEERHVSSLIDVFEQAARFNITGRGYAPE